MKIVPLEKPLKLTNDGNLELVFIGVGSAFSKTLYNTNLLIIKGKHHLLVDFGTTGPAALPAVTGLDLNDITHVLPTHSHCDHIGGIEQLALWNRYIAVPSMGKPKLTMIISQEYQHILWNMSLRGGMEWNEINEEGESLDFNDYFDVIRPTLVHNLPRPTFEVNLGSMHIELFGTNHIPEQATDARNAFITYGMMIDKRIFFSGDTKFDRSLIELYAQDSKVMFHDTSFMRNPVHASLDELRTLPADIKEKMYLVHYGDAWQDKDVSGFAGLAQQGIHYIFD